MRLIFYLVAVLLILSSCEKEPKPEPDKYPECLNCMQVNQNNIVLVDTCVAGFENVALYESYIDSLINIEFDCQEQNSLILLSIDMEKVLGEILKEYIESDTTFNILDKAVYGTDYNYFDGIVNSILSADSVKLSDSLDWETFIIHDSDINGYVLPGGKIFITTGLLKLLDNEAEIAGFLGHLIALVDKRHAIANIRKFYGTSTLLNVMETQDSNLVSVIIMNYKTGMNISYSRGEEFEADEMAVIYLYDTEYNPLGIKNFWIKLMELNTMTPIHYFHPDSGERLEHIENIWKNLGSKTGDDFQERYENFKNYLP